MVHQFYFMHYRLVTELLFGGLTIGAAAVIGYLILLIRL
jgi:hypothetical protein